MAQTDERVGANDGDQTRGTAQEHARPGIIRAELPGQSSEDAAPFHRFGCAVGIDARAFFAAAFHCDPRRHFGCRFASDRVGVRVNGPGDHGRHGDRRGRQDDTARHGVAQLGADRAVEHRDEQAHIRPDMMHHESVAQGLDVVVQHDNHAIDIFTQLRAHVGIGGFMQMHDRDTRSREQGAHAPSHIRPANDDDAARFHSWNLDAAGRRVSGPSVVGPARSDAVGG